MIPSWLPVLEISLTWTHRIMDVAFLSSCHKYLLMPTMYMTCDEMSEIIRDKAVNNP